MEVFAKLLHKRLVYWIRAERYPQEMMNSSPLLPDLSQTNHSGGMWHLEPRKSQCNWESCLLNSVILWAQILHEGWVWPCSIFRLEPIGTEYLVRRVPLSDLWGSSWSLPSLAQSALMAQMVHGKTSEKHPFADSQNTLESRTLQEPASFTSTCGTAALRDVFWEFNFIVFYFFAFFRATPPACGGS